MSLWASAAHCTVDDPHDGECQDPGRAGHRRGRQKWQTKSHKTVRADLQQRSTTGSRYRHQSLHVSQGEPGVKWEQRYLDWRIRRTVRGRSRSAGASARWDRSCDQAASSAMSKRSGFPPIVCFVPTTPAPADPRKVNTLPANVNTKNLTSRRSGDPRSPKCQS